MWPRHLQLPALQEPNPRLAWGSITARTQLRCGAAGGPRNLLPLPGAIQVTDSCNDCKRNDLVVAAKGMTNLSGGVNINRNPTLQVAWAFESCASLITGGIKASLAQSALPWLR